MAGRTIGIICLAYLARLLLRIARTRWTNSCYGRAARESVLLRPSLSRNLQGFLSLKSLEAQERWLP
jgi:hypothetical protein